MQTRPGRSIYPTVVGRRQARAERGGLATQQQQGAGRNKATGARGQAGNDQHDEGTRWRCCNDCNRRHARTRTQSSSAVARPACVGEWRAGAKRQAAGSAAGRHDAMRCDSMREGARSRSQCNDAIGGQVRTRQHAAAVAPGGLPAPSSVRPANLGRVGRGLSSKDVSKNRPARTGRCARALRVP